MLKYDKGNLYIIKEVVETVAKLKDKIEDYNRERSEKEHKLRPVEVIDLPGFEDLKTIVDSEFQKNKEVDSESGANKATSEVSVKSA